MISVWLTHAMPSFYGVARGKVGRPWKRVYVLRAALGRDSAADGVGVAEAGVAEVIVRACTTAWVDLHTRLHTRAPRPGDGRGCGDGDGSLPTGVGAALSCVRVGVRESACGRVDRGMGNVVEWVQPRRGRKEPVAKSVLLQS